MTPEARMKELQEASKAVDRCGGEAIGILQCLDENGLIPEAARNQVMDVLIRWREAIAKARAAGVPLHP